MTNTATNAKSAKSCAGESSAGQPGYMTGLPVSPVIAATSSWQPLSISGNSATVASGATGASCPPCDGLCREGRDCPARGESDAEVAAHMFVAAVLWGLVGWACLVAVWAAVSLIGG